MGMLPEEKYVYKKLLQSSLFLPFEWLDTIGLWQANCQTLRESGYRIALLFIIFKRKILLQLQYYF